MDTLFTNATVITMDSAMPIIENAFVGVDGAKICHLSADRPAAPASQTIDCTGRVMLPGLYNAHAHAAMTMFRGFAGDMALEEWLFEHIFPAERKWSAKLIRTATDVAIAEMIASGCVHFCDMYFFMDTVAEAAFNAGMLANVSNAVIGFDADTYDFHKDNVYEQTLRALDMFHGKFDGQIMIDASIHGAYTSHPPAWRQVLDLAHKHNMRMHVHLSETRTENETVHKTFGTTPTQIFARHGVFDVPTLAAHGVWLDDIDIATLAEKNVSVAHCPISNLKLASGLCNVTKLQSAGVNVALGIDGVSANNSHDMFEEIKMASLLQKHLQNEPKALPAMEALRLATANGAAAMGRKSNSGMIKCGFFADVIIVDFTKPHHTPCHDVPQNLAYSTHASDVSLTMCRGRILYKEGEYLTLDIEKILHEANIAKKTFA